MAATPRAMILAAGLGTRLGDLSNLRPKPMLPICGTPLCRWSVLWLRAQGIREIVINLHHRGEQIEAELGDGRELGVAIAYSREAPEILGTGGGVRRARDLLDDGRGTPIVVVNGKILVDLELAPILERHRSRDAEATMVLRDDPEAERWGSLRLGADDEVVGFLGLARPGAAAGPPRMFTGIQILAPRFLDRIPAEGAPCIVRTAYRSLFDEGRGYYGHVTDAYWWEHSNLDRYLDGLRNVLDGRAALAHAERPLRGVDPSATIGEGAKILGPVWIGRDVVVGAGAQIGPHVELGDGVQVDPGVCVRAASAWPGARVSTSCERCVVVDRPPGADDAAT
ncbi:MAG: NDP-sugar synthase [Nannocystaceae bacterium]